MCAVGNDGRLSNIIKVVVCEVKFSSLHATHLFIVGMVYELAEGQHDSAVAFWQQSGCLIPMVVYCIHKWVGGASVVGLGFCFMHSCIIKVAGLS